METLETVNLVSAKIVKDNNTSIVTKFVTYAISGDPNQILIGAGLQAIMPNVFELPIGTNWNIQQKLQRILSEINNISFNDASVIKCPGCGSYLYHQGKFTACMNVDCVISDNNDIATLAKLALFVPGVPLDAISDVIKAAKNSGYSPTVTSIIAFSKSVSNGNQSVIGNMIDRMFKTELNVCDRILHETKNITLTQLLTATIGPFPENFQQIVSFYNNRIIDIVADLDNAFAPLHSLYATNDTRILLSTILNANRILLAHILSD